MNSAPPKLAPVNARLAGIILSITTLGIASVVYFFNPETAKFYPVCQFHHLTGLNCPGCGMTRAIYALMHGNFPDALQDNALLVLVLVALAIRGAWFWRNKLRCQPNGEFFPVVFLWPLLILAIIFTILRNLPAFAFFSP